MRGDCPGSRQLMETPLNGGPRCRRARGIHSIDRPSVVLSFGMAGIDIGSAGIIGAIRSVGTEFPSGRCERLAEFLRKFLDMNVHPPCEEGFGQYQVVPLVLPLGLTLHDKGQHPLSGTSGRMPDKGSHGTSRHRPAVEAFPTAFRQHFR